MKTISLILTLALLAISAATVSAQDGLRVTFPNGSERFMSGDTIEILWSGIPPSYPVRLEYTIDDGERWLLIDTAAVGHRHRWLVPATLSSRCRVRASKAADSVVKFKAGGPLRLVTAELSPDGRRVLTSGGLPKTILWDRFTGDTIMTLDPPAPADRPGSATYSPDGRRIAVAQGFRVDVYDAKTGSLLHKLPKDTVSTAVIVFSPDSRMLATASFDGSNQVVRPVTVWDVETGRLLRSFYTECTQSYFLAFTPDSRKLIAASDLYGQEVGVWDIVTGQKLFTMTGHLGQIYTASFNHDGSLIATASADSTGRIWDASDGRMLHTLGHRKMVVSTVFSHDGSRVATASYDFSVRLWEAETGNLIRTFSQHQYCVTGAIFSPDGRYLVSSALEYDTLFRMWDLSTGVLIRTFPFPYSGNRRMAFSADGGTLMLYDDIRIELWPLYPTEMRSDISDEAWAIIAARPLQLIDTINFGSVHVDSVRDTTIILCRNPRSYPMEITSRHWSPTSSDPFSLRAGDAPFIIPPGTDHTINLRFSPRDTSSMTARMVFGMAGADSVMTVVVRGRGVAPEAPPPDEPEVRPLFLSVRSPSAGGRTGRITYGIDRARHIRLSLFDVLGKEIQVLAREEKGKGRYEMEIDASGLPQGYYFIRLSSEEEQRVTILLLQ